MSFTVPRIGQIDIARAVAHGNSHHAPHAQPARPHLGVGSQKGSASSDARNKAHTPTMQTGVVPLHVRLLPDMGHQDEMTINY